jgi:chromatin assembly factor 1 subunit A
VENDVLGSKFDSIVSLETLEKTVNRLAQRRNYGLDDAPAALSIWRWEVTDLNLVQDAVSNKELAEQRMAERVQV